MWRGALDRTHRMDQPALEGESVIIAPDSSNNPLARGLQLGYMSVETHECTGCEV